MAKIVIIAPEEADDDVKDAVKLLKAAGHDVDTDEPTPKALIHIVLGLLGPNAYGFGPNYGYVPGSSGPGSKEDDNAEPDAGEPGPEVDDTEDDVSDTEFNFESLGAVTVDGELMEAVTVNSDTSFLCVEKLNKGPKTTYSLNESVFSFWPANPVEPTQRIDVVVGKHRTSVELALHESEGKPVLKVGKDLRDMFEVKVQSVVSSGGKRKFTAHEHHEAGDGTWFVDDPDGNLWQRGLQKDEAQALVKKLNGGKSEPLATKTAPKQKAK